MRTSSPTTRRLEPRAPKARPGHADEAMPDPVAIKRRLLQERLRRAEALAARLQVLPDGRRVFLRFDLATRIQHLVLMLSFITLAITGLLQRFSPWEPVAWVVNALGGGEALRVVHRLAALASMAVSFYHAWVILETWFVRREKGAMWPRWQDFRNLVHTVKYNLGLAPSRPLHDRFAIEEKMEYWALLWGQVLMGATGLVMWFPVLATQVLPGETIPVARALHGWEAVLAVLAILTWHLYHTMIRTRNWSIFTGYMTEEEMQEEHPLEYRRILAAHRLVQRLRRELAALEQGPPPEPPASASPPPSAAPRRVPVRPTVGAD